MSDTADGLPSNAPGAAATDPVPAPDYAPGSSGNHAWWVIVAAVLLGIATLVVVLHGTVRHWFARHTGLLDAGPDVYYNFWSGFGSDLGEVTLITAVGIGVYTGVRKVNCHTKGCWRIGHHALDGTPYILCRHHHPHVPNEGATHDHILMQHHRYKLDEDAGRAARSRS
ncbi:hypothetical protein [Aquihabitans sp. McL0605]|uniref:hypothetical protein n=1 Tax=Aquihabitans sp. McL0605 TaxID=3415671 RepID=UPI003CF90821